MECLICNISFDNKRSLASHLQTKHSFKTREYTIAYLHDGKQPMCLECGEETRYVSFTFKRYCKAHSRLAEVTGGRKGGLSQAWNKGKTKLDDERIMRHAIAVTGESNHFHGKNHSQESILKMKQSCLLSRSEYMDRLASRSHEFHVVTPYLSYTSRQHQYLDMECVQCGTTQKKTLQAFERGSLCSKCFPFTTSKGQEEVADFIRGLGFSIETGNRKICAPKEIDIYVPSKSIAFEYNGLYWHKDDGTKDKKYHKNKTEACRKSGIRLMHIFSDEWEHKREIVESMIKNRLGVADKRIGARKCDVGTMNKNEAKEFFNSTHISGHAKASHYLCLRYDKEIVCGLSLRTPHHNKYKGKIEIARLSTAKNIVVSGGFSRLFKRAIEIAKEKGSPSIISYADLRFGDGLVYANNGFSFNSDTGLNFWYTDDVCRYDRFKYRAMNGRSEADVAKDNGVSRIYGCGNYLYEYLIE
jgi:hypothetical protein